MLKNYAVLDDNNITNMPFDSISSDLGSCPRQENSGIGNESTPNQVRSTGVSSNKPDIVISGISGQYPLSNDIEHFKENLFAGVDMVTADEVRWPIGFQRLPSRNGKVYGMDKFDTDFFGISDEDAELMDPQDRLLMEEVYRAILDAGVDPKSLKGTNTGYFHGACYVETNQVFEAAESVPEGKFKALITRIPRYLGLKGPVLDVDTACGSGLSAFSEAFHSVKNGICDQAIATASNTVLRPRISSQFRDLKMITKDGKCKCLDASADGYVRSEAVVATFLQRSKDAKRIYCYLLACRSNSDGYKEEGITFPSIKGQVQLLRDTYEAAGVDAADIDYVEAHITGTKAGDPVETNAMYDVICSKRRDPVMIGCLKSNIGHTEGSSGLCAITKACIIYQGRLIPPNIHYNTPNLTLKGLEDGKMKPVTQTTPWNGHFIPVNCFGFGGANTHLVTADFIPGKSNIETNKYCDPNIIDKTSLSFRVINVCGRTKESVKHIFNCVTDKAMYQNREFLSLLQDFSTQEVKAFPFRGFLIAKHMDGKLSFERSEIKSSATSRLTVAFPGPDSASAAAFDQLAHVRYFKELHEELEEIQKTRPVSCVVEKIVKSVAFQLAFVDLLKGCQVDVGKVVGESTGELSCAYFDDIIDRKTALTAAFNIMNGIGSYLWHAVKQADENNNERSASKWPSKWDSSLTLESLTERMTRLNHSVRFNDVLSTSHNDVLLEVNPTFTIKSRTANDKKKKLPELLSHDIASEEQATEKVTLFLVKCLGNMYSNGVSIKNISSLYPSVKYPLSPSTPFFSPIIKWDHHKTCSIKNFLYNQHTAVSFQTAKNIVFRFDQSRSEDSFLFDHKIDGRVLFPATGYLMIVWSALSSLNRNLLNEFPVRFDKIKFMRAVVVSAENETILSVRINEDTGSFEIKESDNIIVSGTITPIDTTITSVNQIFSLKEMEKTNSSTELSFESKDVYKELRIRGYDYGPYFQGIKECSADGSVGKLVWRDIITKTVRDNLVLETGEDVANLWVKSWCSFTDSMLQLQLVKSKSDSRCLFVPTSIETLVVLPEEIRTAVQENLFQDPLTQNESSILDVYQDQESELLFTKGIIVKGFKGSLLQRRKQQVKLLKYDFHAWNLEEAIDEFKDRKLIDLYHKAICQKSVPPNIDIDNERFSLLKHLTRPSDETKSQGSSSNDGQNNQDEEPKREENFENDLIIGRVNNGFTLQQQRFFKSALDVVVYNLISSNSSSNLNLLEVNPSATTLPSIISERIKECLNDHLLYNQYTVSCSLLTTDATTLTEETKQEFKDIIEVSEEELTSESKTLKEKIPSSNLIVVNMTSCQCSNAFENLVKNASEGLKDGGFLMMIYRDRLDDNLRRMIEEEAIDSTIDYGVESSSITKILSSLSSFAIVMQRSLFEKLPYKLILLRKTVAQEDGEDVVVEIGTNDFSNWLDKIKDLLGGSENTGQHKRRRIWLTANPRDKLFKKNITGIIGFAKSLRLETNGEMIRVLIDFTKKNLTQTIDLKSSEYFDIMKKDLVYNIRTSDGVWGSFEHFFLNSSLEEQEDSFEDTEHVYLRSLKPGDLSSLSWVKNQVPSNQDFLKNHVKVHYSALNFKDILFATGRLSMDAVPKNVSPLTSQDSLLGLEYSGVESQTQRRVMGILPFKALSTSIPITTNEKDFMWTIPDSWSLEEAATVPVVYSTVIYALLVRGKLMKGESVLIHAAAGGVGLAAMNVCLYYQCKVFMTVGSEEKKQFLLGNFKGRINEDHIFNSRDTAFEDSVMKMTNGKGLDVILNSLSDDKFDSTIRLLHQNGRFLEIGKVDMINDKRLSLNQSLEGNQSFHGVFLDTLTKYTEDDYFSCHVSRDKELLKKLMAQGIIEGFVTPLPKITFTREKIEDAFRFMATGKHIGKVIIEMRPQSNHKIKSLKSTFMNPDKSYLVIGGLGGLGLELVQWLVTKGAKHLTINSRRGITNNYQKLIINRLRKEGIQVTISQTDSTNRLGVKQLISDCNASCKLGLGGVFNSAVVYKDCLFSDQTVDIFEQVSSPKSNATIFLDEETRESCPNLDYFVTFSSISAGRGNEGQTNYNFGNSVMDSVCINRVNDGLPGLSVQWGVIGDVGLVADLHSGHSEPHSNSTILVKQASSEVVLLGSASQRVHSIFETLDRIINYESIGCIASLVRPTNLLKSGKEGSADLIKIISNIIGLKDISRMDVSTSMGSLGIDSLIAVEIKQVIERVTGVCLGLKEVRELTIQGVINLSAGGHSVQSSDKPSSGGFHSAD